MVLMNGARAALLTLALLALTTATAGADDLVPAPVPVPNDPAAQATYGHIGDALGATKLVKFSTSYVSTDPASGLDLKVNGILNNSARYFTGTVSASGITLAVYATPGRTLARLLPLTCWKKTKKISLASITELSFSTFATGSWITPDTTGPAIFTTVGPTQIHWALGGKAPVTTDLFYDAASSKVASWTTVEHDPATPALPAGSTLTVTTSAHYAGVSNKHPKKFSYC
jgi:hypothetical protein